MNKLELDNCKLTTCASELDNSIFSALDLDNFIFNALELDNSKFRNFNISKANDKN